MTAQIPGARPKFTRRSVNPPFPIPTRARTSTLGSYVRALAKESEASPPHHQGGRACKTHERI
jgi:hypothetical protein